MRKKRIAWLTGGLLALATLVGISTLKAERPDSKVVELDAFAVSCPTTNNMSGVVPHLIGKQFKLTNRAVLMVKIIGAGLNGTSTLKAYFQYSADNGLTFNDFATVTTTTGGHWYIPISTVARGSTTVSPQQSGLMGDNLATQGPIGDLLRVKYDIGAGTGGWSCTSMLFTN